MAHQAVPYEGKSNPVKIGDKEIPTAIEIQFPETFSDRAWHIILEQNSIFRLYDNNGCYYVTAEDSTQGERKLRWQGDSLDALELWLDGLADELDKAEPGWENAYLTGAQPKESKRRQILVLL